eukprot:CAMPEP_0205956902 /NCGR_PEP_ID=MMETSP1459-20131121/41036_1 /ASSEMBLY_ACC=CAM_ASM_001120 /TAXON_ID=41880 /ORGANISM="Pycnococcus provasolii, Strain RCC931" /LENGTH=213 /DNA_ID=CAMNT_0053329335 /DNA_START=52 /DNA_END=690 /DNA_ORIENTATION=+
MASSSHNTAPTPTPAGSAVPGVGETAVGPTDSSNSNVDVLKLTKKLKTLEVINAHLSSENSTLSSQLRSQNAASAASASGSQSDHSDMEELKSEFSHRLASLENDLIKSKSRLEETKVKLAESLESSKSLQRQLIEKTKIATTFQEEGESLARQLGEAEAALRRVSSVAVISAQNSDDSDENNNFNNTNNNKDGQHTDTSNEPYAARIGELET